MSSHHALTTPADCPPVNAAMCPLCGQPNGCAMEAAKATGQACGANCGATCAPDNNPPCWCTTAQFPPSLLQRVPTAARGKACICAACAREAAAS